MLSQSVKVLIDSGATENYMNPRFQQQLRILEVEKTQSESISELKDESLRDHLTVESDFVSITVMSHKEQINFDVTSLKQYDVMLGIPWLRNHNLEINWKTGHINFVNCDCSKISMKELST